MAAVSLIRLFLLAAVWGGSFLLMRIAVPVLDAVPTAFYRVVLASAGLYVLIRLLRVARNFQGKFWSTILLGTVNSGLPFLFFAVAARALPAGYSAILNATTPLMGVIVGAVFFGERINTSKALGVLVGLGGVAVLARTGPLHGTSAEWLGIAACLGATFCYAIGGFLTRRWISQRGGLDSRLVAFGSQAGAVLTLLPFLAWALFTSPHVSMLPAAATPVTWLALGVLGLVCTSLAYIFYFQLIADVGPLKALTVTFLIPVFGVLWGKLALDEPISPAYAVGGGLIALALWLVLRRPRTPPGTAATSANPLSPPAISPTLKD